ncbi:MAG TPA: hypothetical protein VFX59_15935 [Polyangiales bacterium]|nr:hypothetical protein [Polyangiales bacterium]
MSVFAATASAQTQPEHLSGRGRLLIAGELGGWWQNHDNWHVNLGPSVAYFLRDRIGLGAYLTYRNARQSFWGLRQRSYDVGVSSVNELPLAERLSLWPIVSVGYLRRNEDSPSFGVQATTPGVGQIGGGLSVFSPVARNWMHFGLFLPLVYQINSHVGVGMGPDVALDWAPDTTATDVQVGLKTWIPISI